MRINFTTPTPSRGDLSKLRLAACGIRLEELVCIRFRAGSSGFRRVPDTARIQIRILPLREISILLRNRDAGCVLRMAWCICSRRWRRRRLATAELRLHILLRRHICIPRSGRYRMRTSGRGDEVVGSVCVLRTWSRRRKRPWDGWPRDALSLLRQGGWGHIAWHLAFRDRRPVRGQSGRLSAAHVGRRDGWMLIGEAIQFDVAGTDAGCLLGRLLLQQRLRLRGRRRQFVVSSR